MGILPMIEFYDRTSYWLFIFEIPHIRGKELLSAITIRLSGVYPGNINDCNIQIRKNGSKKGSHLVFVLKQNAGKTMLPLFPLFALKHYSRKTANVLYVHKNYLDYVRIENGAIISSTVKARTEPHTGNDIVDLCGAETPLTIYRDRDDAEIQALLAEKSNILLLDINDELKKTNVHTISLFSEKSSRRRIMLIFSTAAALAVLSTGSWLVFRYNKNEKEHTARIRLEQEQRKAQALELQQENLRLAELKLTFRQIASAATATPFDIAAVISECTDSQTRIQSATYNGNFFQIEGVCANPLELLRKFETHRLVRNVRLHQVHPAAGRDTFTLSGTIELEKAVIDESLPVHGQIAVLENLIANENNFTSAQAPVSPSVFGESVKNLFTKQGCIVTGYQFMDDQHETTMEFSLMGSAAGFFGALFEIETANRLWDILMTRVRNLYPRNMLDIVIRMKDSGGTLSAKHPDHSLIARISRNYFATPAFSAPVKTAVVKEQPLPAPVRTECASWLEYVGSVNDDSDTPYIYIKNTKTGEILKLEQSGNGNMKYIAGVSGNIIVCIDDHRYEIDAPRR